MKHIVKNQHIFPKASLDRFTDEAGNISVLRLSSGPAFPQKTRNKIFCVDQEWDQRAEIALGKVIEDDFQELIENILLSFRYSLSKEESTIVSKFYALWSYRSCINEYDDSLPLESIKMTPNNISDERKTELELMHIHYVDESGRMPDRFLKGIIIQGGIMHFLDRNPDLSWCLVKSPYFDLILPDNPANDLYIPVSPDLCLLAGNPVAELSKNQSIHANKISIEKSKEWVCGRDLAEYENA